MRSILWIVWVIFVMEAEIELIFKEANLVVIQKVMRTDRRVSISQENKETKDPRIDTIKVNKNNNQGTG